MVDVSDKVLQDAKTLLVNLCAEWGKTETGVTLGRVMRTDGKVTHGVGYNQCHAWLSHAFNASKTRTKDKNFLILSCHSKFRSKGICSPEAHEALILWMASDECPFSEFILNRDDEDSLLNGGVILYCGPDGIKNENHAMWVCKVLRYAVEGSNAIDVWYELYKSGVNPILALYVATYVRTVKGATFGWTGAEGHSAVFSGAFWGAYKASATPIDLLRGIVNDEATRTTEVFADPKNKQDDKSEAATQKLIQGFCKPCKIDDGWGGTVDGNAASKATFVKQVLDWQAHLEEKLDKNFMQKVVERVKKPKAPAKDTVYLEMDL